MPDIKHRVVVRAPLANVYTAIATKEGLSNWWTRDGVRGESSIGSQLEFYFDGPEPAAVMRVKQLDERGHVSWGCVAGADEWIGTSLNFDLRSGDGETVVMFAHADWREPGEFMAHCSARWAYFMLSAKRLVETGAGTPFPDDLKF